MWGVDRVWPDLTESWGLPVEAKNSDDTTFTTGKDSCHRCSSGLETMMLVFQQVLVVVII